LDRGSTVLEAKRVWLRLQDLLSRRSPALEVGFLGFPFFTQLLLVRLITQPTLIPLPLPIVSGLHLAVKILIFQLGLLSQKSGVTLKTTLAGVSNFLAYARSPAAHDRANDGALQRRRLGESALVQKLLKLTAGGGGRR
jgi:hypothetical protein